MPLLFTSMPFCDNNNRTISNCSYHTARSSGGLKFLKLNSINNHIFKCNKKK